MKKKYHIANGLGLQYAHINLPGEDLSKLNIGKPKVQGCYQLYHCTKGPLNRCSPWQGARLFLNVPSLLRTSAGISTILNVT